MTRHHPDLGSASDWSCRARNLIQPIRGTTQIWVVTRHQYGISALVSQMSFGGENNGSVAKCRLFSQAEGGSVCSQGGLLHSPRIFSPRTAERVTRPDFSFVCRPPLQRKKDNDHFLFLSSYVSFIILLLQVLFVKLKEFEIRAKKDDNFAVYFVQSL